MGQHSKQSKVIRATTVAGIGLTGIALTATPANASPDWGPIITCESGGNPTAQNAHSSASGLFQFLDSTWRGLGGSGRAKDASVSQQYAMANKQYAISGFTAWNASKGCWAGKVGNAAPYVPPAAKPAPKKVAPMQAAPTMPAPKHAPGPGKHYIVKDGDCLSRIAAENTSSSWSTLYDLNRATVGGNPDLIFPDQDLILPS